MAVTWNYALYMLLITTAFVLALTAWIRMIGFFRRNRQPEQDTLNPFNGPKLWFRFFTPGAFGPEVELQRRSIARQWTVMLVAFLLACVVFVVFPFGPDNWQSPS